MTRAEHVQWCQERARYFLDRGDAAQAVTSMLSDLGKHPDTKELVNETSLLALAVIASQDIREASRFVEGFGKSNAKQRRDDRGDG